jgi:hypothetical protein
VSFAGQWRRMQREATASQSVVLRVPCGDQIHRILVRGFGNATLLGRVRGLEA